MATAPMMLLEDTAQAADMRASKAPSDVIGGYGRIKTYIKADDWKKLFCGGMRTSLPFDQPFQVASDRTGLNWNVTNRVFLGQLAGCNLRCGYCYVDQDGFVGEGRSPSVVEVGSRDYVDAYIEHVHADLEWNGVVPAGVLRYSGGEPFLFQEWLAESVEYASGCGIECYVGDDELSFPVYSWVDTNLTLHPSSDLLDSLAHYNVGVCGCFKPGQCDLDDQLNVVRQLVEAGVDLYMYYPSHGGTDVDMRLVLDGLSEICPNLPLRLWVIGIRWSYAAMKDRRGTVSDEDAAKAFTHRRTLLDLYVIENCDREFLHLPSHQVPI